VRREASQFRRCACDRPEHGRSHQLSCLIGRSHGELGRFTAHSLQMVRWLEMNAALSWHSTMPTRTPTRTSSGGSSPTRPTRAISWSYSCGKLNDTPIFSRRSSRGCRRGCPCRCRRRGMPALVYMAWICVWNAGMVDRECWQSVYLGCTRDRTDRVSHNETPKHTDYCRRVSLRAARHWSTPAAQRHSGKAVGRYRSVNSIFTSDQFFSEWTEMDRVRDASSRSDCFGHFQCSPALSFVLESSVGRYRRYYDTRRF